VLIQLVDRLTRLPGGVADDVSIRVGKFIYPVDFVVLGTKNVANVTNQIRVILGCPFPPTSNALLNCREGYDIILVTSS